MTALAPQPPAIASAARPRLLVVVSPGRISLARDAFETSRALATSYQMAFVVPREVAPLFASLGVVTVWRPNKLIGMYRAMWILRRAVKRFDPDVVHAHGYGAVAVSMGTFPRALAARTIVTIHDQLLERELSTRYVDNALKRNIVRAGLITCVYPTLARAFEKRFSLDAGAIEIVPHHTPLGTGEPDLARAPGRPGPIFGWHGPLRADRAWEVAIDTLVEVRATLPAARLHVAGTGGARTLVPAYARERRVEDAVDLLGDVGSAEFLSGIDIAIAPRSIDAQPHALLEALCVGIPVVAGNDGATADAVRPLPTGWLVPQDAPGFATGVREAWTTIEASWNGAAAQRPEVLATYATAVVTARWDVRYRSLLRERIVAEPERTRSG